MTGVKLTQGTGMGTCWWSNWLFPLYSIYVYSIYGFLKNQFYAFIRSYYIKINNVVFIMLYLFLFMVYIVFYNNVILYKYMYKYVYMLCTLYTLSSTVFTITKYELCGKYTSEIQRFWKRIYIIFWLIEFFLFLLLLVLIVIHYKESYYFLDKSNYPYSHIMSLYTFLIQLFLYTCIIFCFYCCIFFLKISNIATISIFLFLANTLFLMIIKLEFYKFFYIINYYYNIFCSFNSTVTMYLESIENLTKTRNINYYNSLIILIKFWHIIYVYISLIYIINVLLFNKVLSYGLLSSFLQNINYLFFFNFIYFLFFLKILLNNYLQESYYYFFLTNTSVWYCSFFNECYKLII